MSEQNLNNATDPRSVDQQQGGSALPSWAQLRDDLEAEVQATLRDMMYPSYREDVIWRMFLAYRDTVLCNGWPDRQPSDSAPRNHGCELALKDLAACQKFLASGQLDFLKPGSLSSNSSAPVVGATGT